MREYEPVLVETEHVYKHSDCLYEITSNTHDYDNLSLHARTVVVISGPPGGGKDTLVEELMRQEGGPSFDRFRTATTRPVRKHETEQEVDPYYRYQMLEFIRADLQGEFLETNFHESDKGAQFYGTPISEFQRIWETGKQPILRVDPNGARNLRHYWQEGREPFTDVNFVYIYITAPTVEDLRRRLIAREMQDGKTALDAEQAVEVRWSQIIHDLNGIHDAHFVLLNQNDRWDECFTEAKKILEVFCPATSHAK